jgi:ankyrin repeat protein
MKSRSIVLFVLSLLAISPSTEVLAQKSGSIDLYIAENTTETQQAPSWQEIVNKAPSSKDKQAWINYFNTEIPRYLELGGDPNAKTDRGYTLLYFAVGMENRELVELLIAKGADLNAKDSQGKTPLDVALESNRPEVVEILKQKDAVSGQDL